MDSFQENAVFQALNPTADVLDRLCSYFRCRIEDLVEHIPDHPPPATDGKVS